MGTPAKSILTSAERTRQIARVLWVTLALNWGGALLKIVFGWTTHCMAITADGFHSLSDGTTNIIGLIGISISGHPADRDHPYGHQKFETMASVAVAAMLLFVSFGIFQQAVLGLFKPHAPEVTAASFIVMGLTLAANLFVVWYERRAAKRLKSDLLLSDSWHTLTDVFVTCGVFAALVGIRLNLPVLDSIFSLGIAGMIAYAAFHILKDSMDVLTDKIVMDPSVIEKVVRRVQGVADCHEIRTRGKSHAVYVDLHVLVDPAMSVEVSHRLASRIEHDIKAEIEGVEDVVVHIEPTTHDHSELKN
jgi:cation diffusion facilitator family transporter